MTKSTNYILYLLNLALILSVIALSGLLFTIRAYVIGVLDMSYTIEIIGEIFYYLIIIHFIFTERAIKPKLWVESFVTCIVIRSVLILASGLLFKFLSSETSFLQAFWTSAYGNPIIFMTQTLSTPFLAFPLIFSYEKKTQSGKKIILPEKDISESIHPRNLMRPEEISNQTISMENWARIITTSDPDEKIELPHDIYFSNYFKDIVRSTVVIEEEQEKIQIKTKPKIKTVIPSVKSTKSKIEEKITKPRADQIVQITPEEKPMEKTSEIELLEEPDAEFRKAELMRTSQGQTEIEKVAIKSAEEFFSAPTDEKLSLSELLGEYDETLEEDIETEKEYIVKSVDDEVKISIRKIIELNRDNAGAAILDNLIKRGTDYVLQIPLTDVITQLKLGGITYNASYIYDEIPIELVNFISSQSEGRLSDYDLFIPSEYILAQIEPGVLEEVGLSEIPQTADVSDTNIGISSNVKMQQVKEIAEEVNLDTEIIKCEKASIIYLKPQDMEFKNPEKTAEMFEWFATIDTPEFENDIKVFIETNDSFIVAKIGIAFETTMDSILVIGSKPVEINKAFAAIDSVHRGFSPPEKIPIYDKISLEELTVSHMKKMENIKDRSGFWIDLPGKTIAVISELTTDEDHIIHITTIGDKISELLAGLGNRYASWTHFYIFAENWNASISSVPGGILIFEASTEDETEKVISDTEKLSEIFKKT
jgi:hypothetical protein